MSAKRKMIMSILRKNSSTLTTTKTTSETQNAKPETEKMAFKPTFNPATGRFTTLVRLSFFKGFEKTASFENGSLKYRTNGLIYKEKEEGKAQIKVINE